MPTSSISFKKIHQLAIPALIAGVAEPLLSIADLAIVGNIKTNTTECLGAIGVVGAFLSMLIWVFGQAKSSISAIVSQHLGANNLKSIQNFPAQAIFIIVVSSSCVLLLTFPFISSIFSFYNASGLLLEYAVKYYKIRALGFPFTVFTIAVFGVFRGLQNTNYPMIIALVGTIVNIVLDVILVYGIKNSIPALDIEGAAYASVIAQLIMAVMAFTFLMKKTTISLKIVFPFTPEISRFLQMIFNLFIRTIALNIALYFGTSFATSYGNTYVAAYTIGFNLWLTAAFMLDGYSSAGNILSGKLIGEKKYKTLFLLGKKLRWYGFLFGVFLAVVGAVFYFYIGQMFTKETKVLEQFYATFWIILIMQPICAIAFIYDGIFKGLGKTKYLRNILLLATILVFIPILLIADYFNYKLYGIWLAFYLWIIARAFPLIVLFNKKIVPKAIRTNYK